MADEVINNNHSRIIEARSRAQQAFDAIIEIRNSHHTTLANISFLTDKEVASLLRVGRRTVQNYRDSGILPYYIIGGKCLYVESEIACLLEENFHPRYTD